MQFQGKADVYTSNGEKAGVLDRVVIDPRNRQVTHLIVQKGLLFPSDKVVAVSMVAEADKDRVVLSADAGNPENLPDFTEEHFVQTSTEDWVEPPAGGTGVTPMITGAAATPLLLWYPTVAAGPAQTHVASEFGAGPAAGAVLGNRAIEVERNIPEDTVPLKEGAKVIAADGQHVGNVERLFTDSETSEVTHLLLSQGLFLRTRMVIPMAWVLDVGENEVRLAIGSNLLQGLRSYEGE
jgi:sporulation protein YlmC with PRC-barrel domain